MRWMSFTPLIEMGQEVLTPSFIRQWRHEVAASTGVPFQGNPCLIEKNQIRDLLPRQQART
jgi:hypothetical protein